MSKIEPFTLAVDEAALAALRNRLEQTRWPPAETVNDWSQGAPLGKVRALCDYWREQYDWRRCESELNALGQFRTEIDGLGIHFIHVRSPHEHALPLLLTHGWPGSVIEFVDAIGPLTDPGKHGGNAGDAFHVVIPSLPGYGFSDAPGTTGWGVPRIAAAWSTLMARLGYTRWVAQGGDWGAAVTRTLGSGATPGCAAVHINMCVIPESVQAMFPEPTECEQAAQARAKRFRATGMGYHRLQSTRPQTLAYGLTDSPAAQAAWIYDKIWEWTDRSGVVEDALTPDKMLDNIMLYWLPKTAASSARLYWERRDLASERVRVPLGVSIFPKDIVWASRRWAEQITDQLVYFNETARGGHFAAWEEPLLFVEELRRCFAQLR